MPNEHKIKSEKILVKDIFSTMWFRIPEYQRPYIWSSDEVNELLDDLTFANREKPDHEYFLGSFVFQSKKANASAGQEFDENDLLDGQQRSIGPYGRDRVVPDCSGWRTFPETLTPNHE